MSYQTNFNSYAAFLQQSGIGAQASGVGGTILRQTGGTPGKLTKTPIESKEVRRDAQRTRGRHGMQATTAGAYTCEVSLGAFDPLYQALLRGAWDTEITLTAANFTSLTYGAHVINFTSGNPIALGIRAYDVIELVSPEDAGNGSKNIRVAGVTSNSISTFEALTVNNTPDTDVSLKRRGRKVIMPPAGQLVNRYFTIDEYEYDIATSRIFTDMMTKSGKWTMTPNNILTFDVDFVGTGAFDVESGTGAPLLVNPTTPSGSPMAVLDASVLCGGVAIGDLTSFDLTIDIAPVAPPVAASKISPTVLPGQASVTMNLKVLRKDDSWDVDYLNEAGLSLQVLAVPNMSEPKDFLSLSVPYFTIASADLPALSTAGGARDVTISVPSALIGSDPTGSGFDATMMAIQIANNS